MDFLEGGRAGRAIPEASPRSFKQLSVRGSVGSGTEPDANGETKVPGAPRPTGAVTLGSVRQKFRRLLHDVIDELFDLGRKWTLPRRHAGIETRLNFRVWR